ncbi:class I SAM-dependent methyltransferase [Methylobacterium nodulans]|uniref:Methyltransferase type 11 n=1 Tax=Methylobacterium nodulans (strain LMG 21967 / CNCM I-2342 / ORS 2060) TaxID=460265 RepID=B8IFG7_METNO|nr:class I SAM-dependent methyltransferase [Methylobacterium nodulans]ACL57702.1 Methyltransferase type 11 [Methylobacterium nodulans ORS 2060]
MTSSSAPLVRPNVTGHGVGQGVTLALDPPGRVSGRIRPGATQANRVTVLCDGRPWATVPVVTDASGASFACELPSVTEPTATAVEVRDGAVSLGEIRGQRVPRRNAHGLDAASVLAVYDRPLFSVPWLRFDGAHLVVSGSHLPPAGNPELLSVRFGDGVAYTFDYPLLSPEFANHFWYWPNAEHSNFVLIIDLPSCRAGSDPFQFEFVYPDMDCGSVLPAEHHRIGRRISIPPRLDMSICFPRDSTQLTRVQTWSDDQSVTFTGYNTFKALEALFAHYGVTRRPGVSILDWGCGHGRVTRHFIQNWPEARISGADIDAENAGWCRRHLNGSFSTVPLLPPTDLPGASFDGIFGVSVMTHLTAETQAVWLDEIARLLKPDGVPLITFAGPAAAAFSSVFRSRAWWQNWTGTGFDDAQHDPALDGKIEDNTYYRNTLHTAEYTRRVWSRHVDVVDIIPSAIGYQDMAVLRRKA